MRDIEIYAKAMSECMRKQLASGTKPNSYYSEAIVH
jgi:hypothetical protein